MKYFAAGVIGFCLFAPVFIAGSWLAGEFYQSAFREGFFRAQEYCTHAKDKKHPNRFICDFKIKGAA